MFGSDWSGISKAIAGLTALVAVVVGAALWIEADSAERHYQIIAEQRAANYANATEEERLLKCAILGLSSEDCQTQARETARPEQRDEYDLEAQRIMAAWTRAMGKASLIGVAVVLIGLGLIFVTFRETRRAASAAVSSAHADRAWICHHSFEKGTLSGVFVDGHPIRNGYVFSAIFKNMGRSPAIDVSLRRDFVEFEFGDALPEYPADDASDEGEDANSILGPEQTCSFHPIFLDDEAATRFRNQNSRIATWFVCEYRTIYDAPDAPKRRTALCIIVTHTGGVVQQGSRTEENVEFVSGGSFAEAT